MAALLIGVARDSFSDELGAGDFLIRQVVGVSVKDGSLIFGDKVTPGKRFRCLFCHLCASHHNPIPRAAFLTLFVVCSHSHGREG